MSVETEIKFRIEDAEDFCLQLKALNAGILAERHFEDNYLLDFSDGRLQSAQCLLRVRFAKGEGLLTFKGPAGTEGIFKTREELETKIGNNTALLQILERIGMSVSFRYQKFRREYETDQIHVAVDETPIGNFVEFEGAGDRILALARRMGIAESRFLRLTYYSLYIEHCREKETIPSFMVF